MPVKFDNVTRILEHQRDWVVLLIILKQKGQILLIFAPAFDINIFDINIMIEEFIMQTEFEAQVLDIDKEAIIKKLRDLGAKEEPEVFQRRWVYDINPSDCTEWIRLRTNGKKTTICHKIKQGIGISGTSETEIEVDNFEKAHEIISGLKFYCDKYYQENKRQIFRLKDLEFSIENWPMIPNFLEIEASSEKKVYEGLKLLGLEKNEHGHFGHVRIYRKYGIDLHSMPILKFDGE